MTYRIGQKVKVKTYDTRPAFWNDDGKMDKWMGKIVTITSKEDKYWHIKEDPIWKWRNIDFEIFAETLAETLQDQIDLEVQKLKGETNGL